MAFLGLFDAFVATLLADLKGSDRTRSFTRTAFLLVLLEHGGMGPSAWLEAVGAITTGLL